MERPSRNHFAIALLFEQKDNLMLEVHPQLLWIGHAMDVREPRPIFEQGIRAVVDLAYEEKCAQLPRQLIYCRFPLNDGGGNDLSILNAALKTVCEFLNSSIPTLIGCSAGMSRSPSVAAFALSKYLNQQPDLIIGRIADKKALELKSDFLSDLGKCLSGL